MKSRSAYLSLSRSDTLNTISSSILIVTRCTISLVKSYYYTVECSPIWHIVDINKSQVRANGIAKSWNRLADEQWLDGLWGSRSTADRSKAKILLHQEATRFLMSMGPV